MLGHFESEYTNFNITILHLQGKSLIGSYAQWHQSYTHSLSTVGKYTFEVYLLT